MRHENPERLAQLNVLNVPNLEREHVHDRLHVQVEQEGELVVEFRVQGG
jgi:hypothetical protein